jgi:Tol biopolymer transport system component/DNA-binding winged helix-turn-helix (wHTH) protein
LATPAHPRRCYAFGPFRLDPATRLLFRDGEILPLSPKIIETLMVLVENHGQLVSKDELLKAVWPDTFVEESNLTHNISALRRTLGESCHIETIPKRGYRLVGQVSVTWQDAAAGESAAPAPPRPEPEPRQWMRSPVAAAILVAAAGVALTGYLLFRSKPPPVKNAAFTQLTDQPGQELYPSLSPDGNSVVYTSRASGNWDIYLQRVGGRNTVNLTQDCSFDDTQPAFSPDGQRIAFRSEREGGGIFVMGATGESVKRVTDFGYHPAWSPDGAQIVCATASFRTPNYQRYGESQLVVVRLDAPPGPQNRRVVAGPNNGVQPVWSPHGCRLAYWRRGIWTVSAEGGQPVAVTADASVNWNPVWSPSGDYLYFSSNKGGSFNAWRAKIDEKSGKLLAAPEPVMTPSSNSGYFGFSRDGRRMCYVQSVQTENLQRVAFDPIKETAVGPPVPVTRTSRMAATPDLSPDGEWLAFYMWGRQDDLYLIRTDGTGFRQLTDDVHRDRVPRWSPDGKLIAWQSTRTGKYEIWTMNPDGSDVRQLTRESRGHAYTPTWSPDGKRLVYSIPGLGPFIIEVERPWPEQTPQPLAPLNESGVWFWARSWSPDGRSITGDLQGPEGTYSGVGIYWLESKKYRRLTRFGAFARWLSDSRRVMFIDEQKLYVADSESGRIREIFSVAPHGLAQVFALAGDDRLIVYSLQITDADIWLMSLE